MTPNTPTKPVDLAEARLSAYLMRMSQQDASARLIDVLADEVEALRKATASLSVCELAAMNPDVMGYCKHWEGRAVGAEAELAALKAVGPDGLPPLLTEAQLSEIMEKVDYTYNPTPFARAVESAVRAAIAAQQPVEVTDEQLIGLLKASYGANMMVMKSDIEFARAVLALAQKGEQ